MLRLILGLWLLFSSVLGGPVLAAEPGFVQAPGFPHAGPQAARGALVWVHGTYGREESGPPDPPDFVGRQSASGLDVWCFNRDRGADPLAGGAERLAGHVRSLRAEGYRRIVVAGHSRGAWLALMLLAHPDLADAIVAFSPAAHGTREERKAQAMGDWSDMWAAALGGTRVVLVQLADDPWDPDPARRLTIARQHWGERLLPVFHPDTPRGHGGVYEPAFDERFGAAVAAFAR